ncbi:hypothetical protein [Evansella clarkii]|nr:hypothetical protein [Evansella clarkii]
MKVSLRELSCPAKAARTYKTRLNKLKFMWKLQLVFSLALLKADVDLEIL